MKHKGLIAAFLLLLQLSVKAQADTAYLRRYNIAISNLIDNGNYQLAEKKADSLYILSKQINYKLGIAESYNLKGVISRDQSDLRDALENFLNALTLFEELRLPVKVAGIQNNIGLIYAEIKEYRTALAYYFKAEQINLKRKNKLHLAINYNNMATCYQKLSQFASAQTYLNKSLKLRQDEHDTVGMAMANHNIGLNYQLTGKHDSAIIFFNVSLGYLNGMSENIGHAYNYLELGNTLLQDGKLNAAEGYLLNALRIAEKSELEGVKVEAYKYLSHVYEQKSDFKNAFKFQNLFLSSKENIESDESKNEILKKELEYDFNKRQELQRKDAENKQAVAAAEISAQKKLTAYAIIALIVLSGLIIIVFRSYNQKRKTNFIISKQKEIVEHKNKEILDSINYARYIQTALLPSETVMQSLPLKTSVLYKPKDIVSGDFYWLYQTNDTIYLAAADCTGHGVPGALVSVVGNNGLNRCVKEFGISEPGKILDKLSALVEETFDASENELKDGMDISFAKFEKQDGKPLVSWSGANNPLWIIRDQQLIEIKPDKQPVGKYVVTKPFATHHFGLKTGDRIYLFTDGYADQFGGPAGKKFKYKQLEAVLLQTITLPLNEQKQELERAFNNWKGSYEQVDDVCIVMIEI